jgi:epoxyqueuosine reductase
VRTIRGRRRALPASAQRASHVAAYAQRGRLPPGLRKALRPLAAELRAAVAGSRDEDLHRRRTDPRTGKPRARAGVGWIGKTTLVVTKSTAATRSSLILWTGELRSDAPRSTTAAGCRRCLDACPTQALTAPYQMDARSASPTSRSSSATRFLSSTAKRSAVRASAATHCLAACPTAARRSSRTRRCCRPTRRSPARRCANCWSGRATASGELPRHAGRARAPRGFLRNLLVAAGNSRDASLREVVLPFRDDGDTLVAEHADWACSALDEGRIR